MADKDDQGQGGNEGELSPTGATPGKNAAADKLKDDISKAYESIFSRPITPQEFYFLLSRYPFLQICDADYPYIDAGTEAKVVHAQNGWIMHSYGTVIYSGGHELLLQQLVEMKQRQRQQEREDEGGDGGDEGGSGTIVKQYTDVAFEMIELAMLLGWRAAEVITGFYPMQRMAWIAASEHGFSLKGFEPSKEDQVVRNWVMKLRTGTLYPPAKPIVTGTGAPTKRPG